MSILRGDSRPVDVAFGYQITAPGLQGTVEKVDTGDEGFRGGSFLSEEFEEAVKQADLSTQAVFELKVTETFSSGIRRRYAGGRGSGWLHARENRLSRSPCRRAAITSVTLRFIRTRQGLAAGFRPDEHRNDLRRIRRRFARALSSISRGAGPIVPPSPEEEEFPWRRSQESGVGWYACLLGRPTRVVG